MKKNSQHSASVGTPTHPATPPQVPQPQFATPLAPYPYPYYPPPPYYPPSGHAGPSNLGQLNVPQPPSSPPPAGLSLDGFFDSHDISENVQMAFRDWGFEIGDSFADITDDMVQTAGIKILEWKRVSKAYKKYKHSFD